MSRRLSAIFTFLLLAATGCAGAGESLTAASVAESSELSGQVMISSADGSVEGITGGWTVTLDAAEQVADVTPWRRATGPQGLLFDLDVSGFMTPDMLKVTRIAFDGAGNLRLDYRIRHPFRAPNFANPVTASNRADLGLTGRMLFLFDVPIAEVPQQRFFGNSVVANTSTVLNPNHYVRPGNLLSQSVATFNADAFPARLLVDEAHNGGLGNRVGVSNAGSPTGNYDAATGGWQRGNIGVTNNGWTGYDYLHQGQSADNTVLLNQAALTGQTLRFDVAVLSKYTDPRGANFETDPNARMPQSPTNAALFAYRMPNGAIDASDLAITGLSGNGTLEIADTAGEQATIGVRLRDWDARATASTEAVLSNDPDLSHVHPGTAGTPVVEVSAPGLQVAAFVLAATGTASGLPGDELEYDGTLTNTLGTALAGSRHAALIRAVDPENGVLNRDTFHFGVDPLTLAGSPSLAMELITYQSFVIEMTSDSFPTFLNVASWGGSTVDAPLGGETDAVGNQYIVGRFAGSADFDPGPAVELRTATGTYDAYLLALTPAGAFRWVATWGGNEIVESLDVAIAADGTCYATGYFTGTTDFDPGPATVERTSVEFADAFLLSLTDNGEFNWVAMIEGLDVQYGNRVVLDQLDRLYLSGTFNGIADFDPGPAVVTNGSNGQSDAFFLALESTGAYRYHAAWGGTGTDQAYQVVLDDQLRPSIVGAFQNVVDFDPRAGVVTRTSAGGFDCYVLSLTASGDFREVAAWGGPGFDRCLGLAQDSSNQLWVSGFFNAEADFDPGASVENRTPDGGFDAFVLALTPTLAYRWVATFGGSSDEFGRDLTCDALGNSYICGDFSGTTDLDPSPADDFRVSAGAQDVFLVALAPDSAYRVGSAIGGSGADLTAAISLATGNEVSVVGLFDNAVDFDPGAPVAERTSAGQSDGYAVRLRY